jgi:dihydrofolate synthase/folylpolyglutamate synthase
VVFVLTDRGGADAYDEALGILRGALAFGIEPSLVGITALTRRLGDPQLRYPCVQIAGTNGKSSTARFAAALLHAHGYKVGLYTSPQLTRYPECIEINGHVIADEVFTQAVKTAHEASQQTSEEYFATEFELLTAAAFVIFAQAQVDFAVIEAGMGGQWDATNIVDSVVSVITGVSLEHMDFLGSTLEQIAQNKAGIIKPDSVVILGEGTQPVARFFTERAQALGAQVHFAHAEVAHTKIARTKSGSSQNIAFYGRYENYEGILFALPAFQVQNVACAIMAAEAALGRALDRRLLQDALNTVRLPGRFEVIGKQPIILIDAAHNAQAAQVLADELIGHFGDLATAGILNGPWTLVAGILKGKDVDGILRALLPLFDRVIITQSASARSIPYAELAQTARTITSATVEERPSLEQALERARALGHNTVITGSITVAGEARYLLGEQDVWLADH